MGERTRGEEVTKTTRELVDAADEAVIWIEGAALPNEPDPAHRLRTAVEKVRIEDKTGIRTGYLLLIERADGLRRITATVASGGEYISRTGWAALGVDAEVVHEAEVNNLKWARDDLKTIFESEQWTSHGMLWSDMPREELIAAIQTVAESVNKNLL